MNTCVATLRSGRVCGKRALHLCEGEWRCGIHKTTNTTNGNAWNTNRTLLCRYGENGVHLVDLDTQPDAFEQTEDETTKLEYLKGYINFKIGSPVFKGAETLPLVYMSNISDKVPHISKKNLARELASSIEYLVSRPDVYDLDIGSVAEVILMSFTYDYERGIFIANLRRV